jgi:hypothetical protein
MSVYQETNLDTNLATRETLVTIAKKLSFSVAASATIAVATAINAAAGVTVTKLDWHGVVPTIVGSGAGFTVSFPNQDVGKNVVDGRVTPLALGNVANFDYTETVVNPNYNIVVVPKQNGVATASDTTLDIVSYPVSKGRA